jgi:acetolactate synthase I/II/III large subunit
MHESHRGPEAAAAMTNAELIVRTLEEAGVRWVFGIPSGPVLPLIDALSRSSIKYVLTASETSAGFMASVVGMLTGRPGVAASTVGPGATNLSTGIGSAWLDCAPAIAITCNVDTPWLERRIQMRIDHNALFRTLTKATYGLRTWNVGEALHDAIGIALSEPPGPVHFDLPEDVAKAAAVVESVRPPVIRGLPSVARDAFPALEKLLAGHRRPLFVFGQTLQRIPHPERLARFVESQGIPFVSTLSGKGSLPESNPWFAGVIGRARRSDVLKLVRQADLIVAVGYDPIEINYEDWVGAIPVAHLSTVNAEAGPALKLLFNESGDLDEAIDRLVEMPAVLHDWTLAEIGEHRARFEANLRPKGDKFAAWEALDILHEKLPADGILAYDVGAHLHQIASQWRTDRLGSLVATNGWSSMGFGIPAAYAAKLVHPDRTVVGVVGDGCFEMTAGELTVGRRMNLAAPVVILNDGWLTLLRIKQDHKTFERSGVDLGPQVDSPPHYFGVPCRSAKTPTEFAEAMDWALSLDGPSVVEAFVDPDAYHKTVFD